MMSSHIVPDVEAVCDRVGILSGGRIARGLDLHEVYAARHAEVEVTFSGVDPLACRRATMARERCSRATRVTIVRCDDRRLKNLIADVYAAEGHVVEVKPLRTRLEDVFRRFRARDIDAGSASRSKREPILTRR